MNRAMAVVATLALVVSVGCTKNAGEDAGPAGQIEVGDIDLEVAEVDCAEPDTTLYASGVTQPDGDRFTTFDVEVAGEEVVASVRSLRGDDVDSQYVGTGLTPTRTGDEVTVEGTFVAYDGPEQTGESEGTLTFSCTADTDPGGGFVSLRATEVEYDLVVCTETDESFEVRGRVTTDEEQGVTLQRVLLRSGWVDTIDAHGDVVIDENEDLSDDTERAADVETGLFTVRGNRVTGDTAEASIDLTCGIDVNVVTED